MDALSFWQTNVERLLAEIRHREHAPIEPYNIYSRRDSIFVLS